MVHQSLMLLAAVATATADEQSACTFGSPVGSKLSHPDDCHERRTASDVPTIGVQLSENGCGPFFLSPCYQCCPDPPQEIIRRTASPAVLIAILVGGLFVSTVLILCRTKVLTVEMILALPEKLLASLPSRSGAHTHRVVRAQTRTEHTHQACRDVVLFFSHCCSPTRCAKMRVAGSSSSVMSVDYSQKRAATPEKPRYPPPKMVSPEKLPPPQGAGGLFKKKDEGASELV